MNLYATLLTINQRGIREFKITDPYSVHRLVYGLFSRCEVTDSDNRRLEDSILYAEKGGGMGGKKILVLSERVPSRNTRFCDGAIPESEKNCGYIQTKVVPHSFLSRGEYRFELDVNPTIKCSKTGKRVPVKRKEDIEEWFVTRAEKQWGFQVQPGEFGVQSIEVLHFAGKKRQMITINKVKVQGLLRVSDREGFENSFRRGIGRARAFGCGLLQLVPF